MEKRSVPSGRTADLRQLQQELVNWGKSHRRDFPWRGTSNPYAVFLAEVLLHRTRADQVVPLYRVVLAHYPTIESLAVADHATVHRLLHGGGLRWRVESLLDAAKEIEMRFGGSIPRERSELETLPGVGHYIATAIRCFAYGEPDAIVDTNTVRVVARLYGQEITDGLRRNKKFRALIDEILDRVRPKDFNYALLDLAALVCTPRNPACQNCPIVDFCEYGRTYIGKVDAAFG